MKSFSSFIFYPKVLKFEPVFKNPKLPLCGMCSNIKTALSSQMSDTWKRVKADDQSPGEHVM